VGIRPNAAQAIGAGFVATLAMTLLSSAAPSLGMPPLDFAALLGQFLTGQPAEAMSGAWWLGTAVHFIDGTFVFPVVYVLVAYPLLPGRPWLRGAFWGVVLWLLSETVAMPAMGFGFFSAAAPRPVLTVIESLLGHLVWGTLLGAIAGRGVAHAEETGIRRHAAA
jgi:uncharacterized membrane protein YagU involved in acid resistance